MSKADDGKLEAVLKDLITLADSSSKGSTDATDELMEALAYIRCVVKYLQFDVEATQRERNYYMEKLRTLEQDGE